MLSSIGGESSLLEGEDGRNLMDPCAGEDNGSRE